MSDQILWAIAHMRPVMVCVLGNKNGWYHLRSGANEWKQRSPQLFRYESQAWWQVIKDEILEQRLGAVSRKSFGKSEDGLEVAAERIYAACCGYHRARIGEITLKEVTGSNHTNGVVTP